MSRIVVLGAGVIGQAYAAVLAHDGHEVTLVASGQTAKALHEGGFAVEYDGERLTPKVKLVESLDEADAADILLVAVAFERLETTIPAAAEFDTAHIVCMTNPLGSMERFEKEIGTDRAVFAANGLGGHLKGTDVVAFEVKQLPTAVQAGEAGDFVAATFKAAGLKVSRETHMAEWLDTHTVLLAGLSAACLAAAHGDAPRVEDDRHTASDFVDAMSEAFEAAKDNSMHDELTAVSPSFETLSGKVPTIIAAPFWQHEFKQPFITEWIEPYALATEKTEMPMLFQYARRLVGASAPKYTQLLATALTV